MKLKKAGRILHPTDFSRGSEVAFAHALKLSLVTKAELEILHVDRHPEHVSWSDFLHVRETLMRWGLFPAGATEADVADLRISVYKDTVKGDQPLTSILRHLENRPAGLIVLASHHPTGLDRWLHKHIASEIARIARITALFVPHGSREFVNPENGQASLNQVLLPYDAKPRPQPAIDAVQELIALLQNGPATCHLLHVGPDDTSLPTPQVLQQANTRWETIRMEGNIVERILGFSREQRTSLIALTTQGHHGFLDILRGSVTDQVLSEAACPILAVPGE